MEKTKIIQMENITSILDGSIPDGPTVNDGDRLVAETAPGCWGPMITPSVFGGHEITGPVYLNGAEPGDSVAIHIEKIEILSQAMTSGTGRSNIGRFENDPSVKAICPYCKIANPKTYLEGIGEDAIRCQECGEPIMPQTFDNGYTVVYDAEKNIAVALDQDLAKHFAEKTLAGDLYLPSNANQHLATILGRSDFSDLIVRSYPMVGNIGCIPAARMPASKNAGDYYQTISKTDLFDAVAKDDLNDAHMDINSVGEGSIVISPVMVEGAGIYLGDVHLHQGDGEIAGHTLDASARVTFSVHLIKNLKMKGPIILPNPRELDPRYLPFTEEEYAQVNEILASYGKKLTTRNYPILIVGSGENMNAGLENAFERAQEVTGLSKGEIMNRSTVGGEIGVGRTSGMVYITIMLNEETLQRMGLLSLIKEHYAD